MKEMKKQMNNLDTTITAVNDETRFCDDWQIE